MLTLAACAGLDDLCVRFIINLPQEDLSSVPRICFQVEEAQWFYEDFIRPLDPNLPSMTLRTFCLRIFQHCPLLTTFPVGVHIQAFEEFLQYKTRIPVRGAILLNEAMDSVLLVRGWKKGANWSFPRGKINKDEDDLDCAVREVYEETGFDIRGAGLVPASDDTKFIEVTMRDQQIRLYVFRNVPIDTHFQPRTRKEISKIQWYRLSDLPAFRKKGNQNNHNNATKNANNANKFYMVAPFLVPLKKWIVQQHKVDASRAREEVPHVPETVPEETATEDETWNQPQPGQRAPDPDALEGATRELQRLLKMQPSTQGIQMSSQPATEQDKGGALLALLQSSETPVANQHPHVPAAVANAEPAQSNPPLHHHVHHPPAVPQGLPPAFPMGPRSGPGPWAANYYGNVAQVPGVPQHQHQPRHQQTLPPHGPHAPALLHPQPLPPQVQKTGVYEYTTPPPHALQKALGVPRGGYPQAHHGYPSQQQNRHHAAPLNEHSKSLLSAFTTGPSPGAVQKPVELPTNQPQHLNNNPSAPQPPSYKSQGPDIAAAAQPYQQADMNVKNQMDQRAPNAAPRGGQNEKHRSALLGMFKKADLSGSPGGDAFAAPASAPGSNSKPSSLAGASPHVQLASLSLQDQSASPSSNAYHSPRQYNAEVGPPKPQGGTGSSQSLMQLLRRGEESPKPQPAHGPSYAAYDPTKAAPAAYGSPPAPTSFPAPVFQRQQEAPAEHKQKLLSLFSQQQQQQQQLAAAAAAAAENGGQPGKGKEVGGMEYQRGSVASGSGSGRDSKGPISPADRSFLLGYLQSAGGGG